MQNFNRHISDLLKTDNRLVDDEKDLQINVLRDLINNLDIQLIELLISDEKARKKFFIQVKDVYVFKQNDFIFYLDSKVLDGSYTQYANRIGLASGGKFLTDSTDYVLDFPYKDCILEGGQSTEEGNDVYFEYDTEANDYVEKTAKRKEVFYNRIIAKDEIDRLLEPKAFQEVVRYDADGESIPASFTRDAELNRKRGLPEDTITDNLIIKGNNLLALHSLEKEFKGKVKLIYIDPPFNTGNDSFKYNDNFNHSTWLSFMYNRLCVANNLLCDDGAIYINVDDIEEAYLKVVCDSIFGQDNFINVISVKSSTPSGTKTAHKEKTIIKQKDLILVYRKSVNTSFNAQYTSRNNWDNHYSKYLIKINNNEFKLLNLIDVLLEKGVLQKKVSIKSLDINDKVFKEFYLKESDKICRLQSHKNKEAELASKKKKNIVYEHFNDKTSQGLYYNGQVITPLSQSIKKVYKNQKLSLDLGMLLCDFWSDIDFQNTQNEGGVSFPTAKKPELLLARIIELSTDINDIVLDYHFGSGTTGAVSLKLNRQFIGVEQLDYKEDDSVKRIKNVIYADQSGVSKAYNWQGGGSFTYIELAKNNERAKELIDSCISLDELINLFEELNTRYFLNYNVRIKDFKDNVIKEEAFINLSLTRQKELFKRMLDNNQLYVNLSEVEDARYKLSEDAIRLTKDFYQIKN